MRPMRAVTEESISPEKCHQISTDQDQPCPRFKVHFRPEADVNQYSIIVTSRSVATTRYLSGETCREMQLTNEISMTGKSSESEHTHLIN